MQFFVHFELSNEQQTHNDNESTEVQTLGGIWCKYGLKTPLHEHVLGEHTSMKN